MRFSRLEDLFKRLGCHIGFKSSELRCKIRGFRSRVSGLWFKVSILMYRVKDSGPRV